VRLLTLLDYCKVWSYARNIGETGACAEVTVIRTASVGEDRTLIRWQEGDVCSTAFLLHLRCRLTIPTVFAKRWSNVAAVCGRWQCATDTTTPTQHQVRARLSHVNIRHSAAK
jgi:hypothetical protein